MRALDLTLALWTCNREVYTTQSCERHDSLICCQRHFTHGVGTPRYGDCCVASLIGRPAWADSFQYRDFRLLWGASIFQSLGMGMDQIALGWLVLQMTDSPFMVGVAAAARMAPLFFLGILSGAIADRVDRRLFLRIVTWGGSVTSGIMATILLTDVAQVWHVIVVAAATGSFSAFQMTIKQSYIYDIVGPEHALNGLALSAMGQRVGGVVGAITAGVIISTVSIGGQYLAISASYLAAVVVMLALRDIGQAAPTQRESILKNLVGYVQVLRENRTLRTLMFLTAITEVFGFTHQSLLPVFARDVLEVGALGLGFMWAIRQAGGMIALLLLANFGNVKHKGLVMFAAAIGFGLGQMAFSLTTNIFVFLVTLAFINACASIADTLYKTLMQSNVSNEQRGRAMGSWVLSIGVAPVGHVSIGAMAGVLGAQGALLVNGSILAFVTLASAVGMPKIRRL